jgi:hypothetical protein
VLDGFTSMLRRPDGVEIEFGVSLDARFGALIAASSAGAHLTVRLRWGGEPPAGEAHPRQPLRTIVLNGCRAVPQQLAGIYRAAWRMTRLPSAAAATLRVVGSGPCRVGGCGRAGPGGLADLVGCGGGGAGGVVPDGLAFGGGVAPGRGRVVTVVLAGMAGSSWIVVEVRTYGAGGCDIGPLPGSLVTGSVVPCSFPVSGCARSASALPGRGW